MSRNNDTIYNVTNCRSDIENKEIFKNTYKCANIEDHLAKLEYRYQINSRLCLPHKMTTQSGLNRKKKNAALGWRRTRLKEWRAAAST